MKVELAGDGVEAPVAPEVRLERPDEVLVTLVLPERAEDTRAEVANVARRLAEDEAVRPQVAERGGPAFAAQCPPEEERLLRLQRRDAKAARPLTRHAHAGRDVWIGRRRRDRRAHALDEVAGISHRGALVDGGDDAVARAHDARSVVASALDHVAEPAVHVRFPGRERHREPLPRRAAHRFLPSRALRRYTHAGRSDSGRWYAATQTVMR